MKISALEEYGLRCLLQLAKSGDGELLSADEIARREGLSMAYVEKILSKLRRADLIQSTRGMRGGYQLVRNPEDIYLGDFVRAMDGDFFSEICGHFAGQEAECTHIEACGIRSVWLMVARQVYRILDRLSLRDLLLEESAVDHNLLLRFPMAETLSASSPSDKKYIIQEA